MKTTEELIEKLKQTIKLDQEAVGHVYGTTIEGLKKTLDRRDEEIKRLQRIIKELECSRGLFRLNYEQQTKRLQQIVEVLGADPDAIRSEASDEAFQALVLTAAQEHKKWNEHLNDMRDREEELSSLKKGFAELKAKLNVLEDRMSVPPNHKATEIRCECQECQQKRFREKFEKLMSEK